MSKLATVPCFVPLCSTWVRLNGKLFTARDRNDFKLVVKKGFVQLEALNELLEKLPFKMERLRDFVK